MNKQLSGLIASDAIRKTNAIHPHARLDEHRAAELINDNSIKSHPVRQTLIGIIDQHIRAITKTKPKCKTTSNSPTKRQQRRKKPCKG